MEKRMLEQVMEASGYIASQIERKPQIAIVLGSGQGALADTVIQDRIEIPYEDIPNFPVSHVEGHDNKLIFGKIYQKDILMMQGRFHYYEGHSLAEITLPIRVLAFLGIEKILIINAAGGINRSFKPQDLMVITDHINLSGLSPLRGPNEEMFGERFVSMKNAYSKNLIALAKDVASMKGFESEFDKRTMKKALSDQDLKVDLKEGIYAFMPGPQYETDAEVNMLRILGADAVGMSTVPEVIVAAHMGIEVLALSCISNMAGGALEPSHDEVLENMNLAEEKLKNFVMRLIMKM